MPILVFKTSVMFKYQVKQLSYALDTLIQDGSWNFDLDDCDNILRVVTDDISRTDVIMLMQQLGHNCEDL